MDDVRWPHPPLDRTGDASEHGDYWRRPGEVVWHPDPPPRDEPIEVWPMAPVVPARVRNFPRGWTVVSLWWDIVVGGALLYGLWLLR